MKSKTLTLSRTYQSALGTHMSGRSASGLHEAGELGLKARVLGLGMDDLIRMHEGSLALLAHPTSGTPTTEPRLRRAATFLANALLPMNGDGGGLLRANSGITLTLETLSRRTHELAMANAQLKDEVANGVVLAESLRTSETTTSELLRRSQHMQEELRRLSRRLLVVQEEERRRISRELHDVVSQSLSGVSLKLAELRTQTIANAKDFQKRIDATWRLVENSVEVIHQFARDLRPSTLDDLGLVSALKAHLHEFSGETGIRVAFSAQAAVSRIGPEISTALYRVAQESLSNIAKHAKASQVELSLKMKDRRVRMRVSDNGRGLAATQNLDPTRQPGIGLLGMQERVAMLGGTFEVSSPASGGTSILAELPSGESDTVGDVSKTTTSPKGTSIKRTSNKRATKGSSPAQLRRLIS